MKNIKLLSLVCLLGSLTVLTSEQSSFGRFYDYMTDTQTPLSVQKRLTLLIQRLSLKQAYYDNLEATIEWSKFQNLTKELVQAHYYTQEDMDTFMRDCVSSNALVYYTSFHGSPETWHYNVLGGLLKDSPNSLSGSAYSDYQPCQNVLKKMSATYEKEWSKRDLQEKQEKERKDRELNEEYEKMCKRKKSSWFSFLSNR